jgi:hypothetical protein
LLSIESIKQPFLLDNLKSILGLSTLALLYRIGSCRNEETIDNENALKLEKKPSWHTVQVESYFYKYPNP